MFGKFSDQGYITRSMHVQKNKRPNISALSNKSVVWDIFYSEVIHIRDGANVCSADKVLI